MKSGVQVTLFFYLQGKGLEVDPSSQKGRALACIKGGVIVVHSEVNKKNLLYIFSLSLCERERDIRIQHFIRKSLLFYSCCAL